jgi:glycosyltransferase involved in cell wall biosynthesis
MCWYTKQRFIIGQPQQGPVLECRHAQPSRPIPLFMPQLLPPTYLFVLPWSPVHPGGVNQVVINLAREMHKVGEFEPLVLVADWNAPKPVWEEIHGLRTVRWRVRPYILQGSGKERGAYWLWQLQFAWAFRRFCRTHRVAVINAHYPGPQILALDRIRRTVTPAIPLLLSFHGADIHGLRNAPRTELALWRAMLLRTRAVVVCSNDLAQKLADVFGADVATEVVYNGLDVNAFVGTVGVGEVLQKRTILNVAKFEEKKGQDVLLRAFALLATAYPDVNLVLVGAVDAALPTLQALSESLGIAQRVQFVLNLPHAQVANYFQRASIFVLPSRVEPFGIVLLEAGAFALPVVASRVGGIPEILEEGATGYMVPTEDPVALASRLKRLLDDPAQAQAMGIRLRQKVAREFTWTAAYVRYAALVDSSYRSRLKNTL